MFLTTAKFMGKTDPAVWYTLGQAPTSVTVTPQRGLVAVAVGYKAVPLVSAAATCTAPATWQCLVFAQILLLTPCSGALDSASNMAMSGCTDLAANSLQQ